jgi:putative ABC transport system substrate-binding protein
VDVLVSAAGIAAVACHRATTTIPIVAVNVPDPVGRKLVASLNRPGGNLTGLSNMAVELTTKRIELAKEMIKDLSRVALLVNTADEIGSRAYIAEAEAAGPQLGVAVVPVGVRDANDLEGAISKISTDNFQAIVVTHDGLFYVQRKRLADLALERRLPTIGFASEQWEAGVLATYGPNVPTLYRRAGAFIDKILKGANPADLPVEQPTKFELLINLRTAKAIGITVPPTLLARADDVIEYGATSSPSSAARHSRGLTRRAHNKRERCHGLAFCRPAIRHPGTRFANASGLKHVSMSLVGGRVPISSSNTATRKVSWNACQPCPRTLFASPWALSWRAA